MPNASHVPRRHRALIAVLAVLAPWANATEPTPAATAPAPPYAAIVRTFADTLLDKGRDRYGAKSTALWCGIIDVETFNVPEEPAAVPLPKGFRPQDRAVGGCNLHHDRSALYVLRALSTLTGDGRYRQAVSDYLRDYLAVAQHPRSGLIAWGEHLFYNVYTESVPMPIGRSGMSHELVEWTPPWDLLYEVDPVATVRAITGLQYHFLSQDPAATGWLFNRHGAWDGHYSAARNSMPWIKHAALYAYSYGFMHTKTGAPEDLRRAQGTAALYWDRRDQDTDLPPDCLPVPAGPAGHAETSMTSCSLFAYFLLEAGQLDAGLADARAHALRVLLAYAERSWDPATLDYHARLAPGGAVAVAEAGAKATVTTANPWSCSYGDSGLARFGRIAAYAARSEGDARCHEVAQRCAAILRRTPLPAAFTPEEIGFGIHLALDLYDLEHDQARLAEADRLARIAVEKLWTGGLFRRLPGDRFYEAKLGAGDLAAALLRLSLRLEGKSDPEGCRAWTF